MKQAIQIAAFYHFAPVPKDQLELLADTLEKAGDEMGLKGLLIFATEGLNGTISGTSREAVTSWLDLASAKLGFPKFVPKWSESEEWPYRKFKFRLRDEIVTLGKPEVQPLAPKSPTHVSPEEWDRLIETEDVVVLDTRNWYETRIGTFKGAIDPKLEEFHEFDEYLEKSDLPKDKKFLIFCTGGIRCEKAIVEMHNHGFNDVVQLDGGILNYFEKSPHRNFEGECFVFDNRVAVTQDLKPTELYKMCPHCGQPADQHITCAHCEGAAQVCVKCVSLEHKNTCSKNCANHHAIAPHKKGRGQGANYRFKNTQRGKAGKERA